MMMMMLCTFWRLTTHLPRSPNRRQPQHHPLPFPPLTHLNLPTLLLLTDPMCILFPLLPYHPVHQTDPNALNVFLTASLITIFLPWLLRREAQSHGISLPHSGGHWCGPHHMRNVWHISVTMSWYILPRPLHWLTRTNPQRSTTACRQALISLAYEPTQRWLRSFHNYIPWIAFNLVTHKNSLTLIVIRPFLHSCFQLKNVWVKSRQDAQQMVASNESMWWKRKWPPLQSHQRPYLSKALFCPWTPGCCHLWHPWRLVTGW